MSTPGGTSRVASELHTCRVGLPVEHWTRSRDQPIEAVVVVPRSTATTNAHQLTWPVIRAILYSRRRVTGQRSNQAVLVQFGVSPGVSWRWKSGPSWVLLSSGSVSWLMVHT